MTNFLEQSLLKKYVTMIMNSYFKEAIHKDEKWNFRCNVCGDSQKSLRKKRGWILKSKKTNEWIFTCFNCGQTHSLQYWMKKYFPEFHRMFLNEFLQLEIGSEKVILPVYEKKIEVVKKVMKKRDKFISLISNEKNELIDKSIEYVKGRLIPEEVWKKWFVCTKGVMKNRLIIPFYNKEDEIYFWQGRALFDTMYPKYLNCERERENIIYNIDFIDESKPVGVLEGVVDSLFLTNSIATLSTNWSKEIQTKLDSLKTYYIIDYDSSNDTKKRIEELLKQGKVLFNWVKFIKDLGLPKREKWDLNSVVCFLNKNITFNYNDLKRYLTVDFFDMAFFMGGDY